MTRALDPAASAAHIGVTRQTIHRWERSGLLERIDPDGPPRYRPADLERAAARSGSRPDPAEVRASIVLAAATLARRDGIAACTLDRVAIEVGLSRSGVLHHFDHKRDLLRALVDTFVTRFESRLAQAEAEATPGRGRLGRAYVAATTAPDDDLSVAVIVCAVEQPDLLEPVQRHLRTWYRRIDDDGGTDAVIAALAADALWLLPLLGFQPLSALLTARTLNQLRHDA